MKLKKAMLLFAAAAVAAGTVAGCSGAQKNYSSFRSRDKCRRIKRRNYSRRNKGRGNSC